MKNYKQILKKILSKKSTDKIKNIIKTFHSLYVFLQKKKCKQFIARSFIRTLNFLKLSTRKITILRKLILTVVRSTSKNLLSNKIFKQKTPNYCHVCRKNFTKKYHFLQHLRMHYDLKMYKCHRCEDTFAQQNGLNYHAKRCNGQPRLKDVIYEFCETCRKFIEHGGPLRNHILRNHAYNDTFFGLNKDQLQQFETCKYIFI